MKRGSKPQNIRQYSNGWLVKQHRYKIHAYDIGYVLVPTLEQWETSHIRNDQSNLDHPKTIPDWGWNKNNSIHTQEAA